ncbi:hypothetical protein LR48_Vigan01g058900 [Vigna angularis]|uniref:Uncharacterized protein n=1 Tax=Phaseolus angularis TaxID=3914 RepID=A0A0L9TLL3_PHAAN|nr:hypothetical protein LR48_Vigan01g058900 [Vigna angularis]
MNTFCNEPGSSLRVSHHTGLRAAEAGNNDGGLADLERRRQRRSGAVDGERQRQAGSNDGGLADLERRRQRRSRAVDGEQRRQAATTEARRSGEAEAAAIWRGGSRAAEAGSNDGGSPIWSGLVMAIWSGGSRAAEAAAAAEAATEARTEKSESTRGVSTKKRRRMGATGREK